MDNMDVSNMDKHLVRHILQNVVEETMIETSGKRKCREEEQTLEKLKRQRIRYVTKLMEDAETATDEELLALSFRLEETPEEEVSNQQQLSHNDNSDEDKPDDQVSGQEMEEGLQQNEEKPDDQVSGQEMEEGLQQNEDMPDDQVSGQEMEGGTQNEDLPEDQVSAPEVEGEIQMNADEDETDETDPDSDKDATVECVQKSPFSLQHCAAQVVALQPRLQKEIPPGLHHFMLPYWDSEHYSIQCVFNTNRFSLSSDPLPIEPYTLETIYPDDDPTDPYGLAYRALISPHFSFHLGSRDDQFFNTILLSFSTRHMPISYGCLINPLESISSCPIHLDYDSMSFALLFPVFAEGSQMTVDIHFSGNIRHLHTLVRELDDFTCSSMHCLDRLGYVMGRTNLKCPCPLHNYLDSSSSSYPLSPQY